jgi:hypothetical protein
MLYAIFIAFYRFVMIAVFTVFNEGYKQFKKQNKK